MPHALIPPGSHAAREYLLTLGRELPHFWKACEEVRKLAPPVSAQCYLTDSLGGSAFVEAAYALGGEPAVASLRDLTPLEISRYVSPFTMLACWRMTQGIYRIDPAVYAALIDTPLTGDIPSDILARLPEWSLYIETPGLAIGRRDGNGESPLRGFFARIDESDGESHLVLAMDLPEAARLEPQAIAIGKGLSLPEAVRGSLADWHIVSDEAVSTISKYLAPIINLLLYICSTADIHGKHGAPGNPAPVRTRRDGLKLFPADGPRTWEVGVRMGAALRAAYQAEETGAGGGEHSGPRGHVRRAHWHGFRSGPRKRPDGTDIPTDARKFELRWLPPIPVNLVDAVDLPAVIRTVK